VAVRYYRNDEGPPDGPDGGNGVTFFVIAPAQELMISSGENSPLFPLLAVTGSADE
jgi:hypothetical protein